jgi:hypothetical protein
MRSVFVIPVLMTLFVFVSDANTQTTCANNVCKEVKAFAFSATAPLCTEFEHSTCAGTCAGPTPTSWCINGTDLECNITMGANRTRNPGFTVLCTNGGGIPTADGREVIPSTTTLEFTPSSARKTCGVKTSE